MAATGRARRFQLALIKPSRYGDDGYVVQWMYSLMPSNSLAALNAIAVDAAERRVLGPDVALDITAFDEANTPVRISRITKQLRDHGGFGLVALVGVQSNQYPRALDIARSLRAAGVLVIIGGFHVSGSIAMLPGVQPDLQEALDLGVSLFAGEAENRFDEVLRDAAAGALKPIYNYIDHLPDLQSAPVPMLPRTNIERVVKLFSSFDAGRGCPYQCSFCTIINVQGRKSRYRSADDVEQLIRRNAAQGIWRLFITDDNFARNKNWEEIFDRIIALRERENLNMCFIIQVDTLCHRIPHFVEKAARAGVGYVFIGLENINPQTLIEAKKRQNKITEYRAMLFAWKEVGVITAAGYILGFPADTPESIRNDIEIIKRELPLDILEFFCLTPLPGSEDHKRLWQQGLPMDSDLNKYDVEHVVIDHPRMSRQAWASTYRAAWDQYYSREHVLTILRRAAASGIKPFWLLDVLAEFRSAVAVHNLHPLQGGVWRRRRRRDRRPGSPLEPVWRFYPKYVWTLSRNLMFTIWNLASLFALICFVWGNPRRKAYRDLALSPVRPEETENLQIFTHNAGAQGAVRHARKIAALTTGV